MKSLIADYKAYCSFYGYAARGALLKVLLNPGFLLLLFFRFYSSVYNFGGPLKFVGRLFWLFSFFIFKCDISPKCRILGTVIFPHPLSIVIGEGVELMGTNTIYQSVTLGVYKGNYPSVTNCTVYSGAVVCGLLQLEAREVSALSFVFK